MALNKNKNNKNKSINKNITSYPTGAWEDGMEAVVELPQILRAAGLAEH